MPPSPKAPTENDRIVALGRDTLTRYVADPEVRDAEAEEARVLLPRSILAHLDKLLSHADSYRDALLVVLAAPLVGGWQPVLKRKPGWRATSRSIGQLLRELHIKGVNEAFENIGKNSPELARGNNKNFDALLRWISVERNFIVEGKPDRRPPGDFDPQLIAAAYAVVAAGIASTARTVLPRPNLRIANLTFARVMSLLSSMLTLPSGGAHEQYIVAVLIEASVAGENVRVTTKSMSASDRSSGTAGDVEVTSRGRLQEGIEVSANDWREKLSQADAIVRDHGLPRAHVVASVEGAGVYDELVELTERDISVLDVRSTIAGLVAFLDRRGREAALLRLYELLDERLASSDLVNGYVIRLRNAELADG